MRTPRPRTLLIALIVLIPLAAVAWWLGSPLFLNRTVEEDFPFSAGATLPVEVSQAEAEAAMATMAKVDLEASEAMSDAMQGAERVLVGSLEDADAFHQGSGEAVVYRLEDGSAVLRLEDLRVTNGPDLHVILASHPDPATQSDIKSGAYTDLGPLKGNIGSQNYVIPDGVDLDAIGSVVIYCMPFHVVFSTATLAGDG